MYVCIEICLNRFDVVVRYNHWFYVCMQTCIIAFVYVNMDVCLYCVGPNFALELLLNLGVDS